MLPVQLIQARNAAIVLALLRMDPADAQPAEATFLTRFSGTWTGTGTVQRNAATSPWHVSCLINGSPGTNRISIQGSCYGAIIVERRIGAELTFDTSSGAYYGVYTGARVGPARISGTRRGDVVSLTITWPAPVNGDTQAFMTIQNGGSGTLRISVRDNLSPGGPVQQTSNLVLRHR
jgi:hypothetical protein